TVPSPPEPSTSASWYVAPDVAPLRSSRTVGPVLERSAAKDVIGDPLQTSAQDRGVVVRALGDLLGLEQLLKSFRKAGRFPFRSAGAQLREDSIEEGRVHAAHCEIEQHALQTVGEQA